MRAFDELRPPSAGRVLELWRDSKETAQDPLERALLCNGAILAECCFAQGLPVYQDASEVLNDLTGREIERLLVHLAGGGETAAQEIPADVNPAFDAARFAALGRE